MAGLQAEGQPLRRRLVSKKKHVRLQEEEEGQTARVSTGKTKKIRLEEEDQTERTRRFRQQEEEWTVACKAADPHGVL